MTTTPGPQPAPGRLRRHSGTVTALAAAADALVLILLAWIQGWLGILLVALVPLGAVIAIVSLVPAFARHEVAWRRWTSRRPEDLPRLLARFGVRSAAWLLIGGAALLGLTHTSMSDQERGWAVLGIVVGVLVLVAVTAVPTARSYGAVTTFLVILAAVSAWQLVQGGPDLFDASGTVPGFGGAAS